MKENAKKFLEEVSAKPELKAELTKAWEETAKLGKDEQVKTASEVSAKIAKAHGFDVSPEDFAPEKMYLLSEDELKAVAGGINRQNQARAITSTCSCTGGNGIGNTWELYCNCPSAGDGYNTTNNHWRCGCAGGNGLGLA